MSESIQIDDLKCPDDPSALMNYADEFVPLLLARLSVPSISSDDRLAIKQTLNLLMSRVTHVARNTDPKAERFVRALKDRVDREMARAETHKLFQHLNSLPSKDYSVLEDVEDRIVSLIEEMEDSGSSLEQRLFIRNLIGSALSEARKISSSSISPFKEKIEELTRIVTEAFHEIDMKSVESKSSNQFDSSQHPIFLDFWEDESMSFSLRRLFEERN